MNNNRHIISSRLSRIILPGVMLLLCLNAQAGIVVGGSVYGGGKSAEVGTSRTDATKTSTEVIVKSGAITNDVFGAGEGTTAIVHGNTDVEIQGGTIGNNVYGGGNAANLQGVTDVEISGGTITNAVFGGARMAAVNPGGLTVPEITINGNTLEGYSAYVHVTGGTINDLYGGNDLTGTVEGGGILDIRSSINGNIYGGGNGSYAYTDQIEGLTGYYYDPGENSLEALKAHRPNAERVYINVEGTSSTQTVLYGSLFCGGNSASILHEHEGGEHQEDDDDSDFIRLNIGKYVTANAVFLGNNGANMIGHDILALYAGSADPNTGLLSTAQSSQDYSSIDLTDGNGSTPGSFADYMEAVNLSIKPRITFNSPEYTTYIGSLYCGGNVGSMTYEGENDIDFDDEIIIYDKLVGGCNTANIEAVSGLNADYKGGILGTRSEQALLTGGQVDETKPKTVYEGQDRLVLNFNGLRLQPLHLITEGNSRGSLVWNTRKWITTDNNGDILESASLSNTVDLSGYSGQNVDYDLRLVGAAIYGGCYSSGHINGNVVINILDDLVDTDAIFAEQEDKLGPSEDNNGNPILDEHNQPVQVVVGQKYKSDVATIHSGVDYDSQAEDVMSSALYVYGAGYGANTEIWGSTTINLHQGFAFQALGGGEQGTVGKKNTSGEYYYDPAYSTYINLNGPYAGHAENEEDDENEPLPEAEYLYGGGFEGLVAGNTHMYLGNGRVYDAFGGACNANILGHSETYIGKALAFDPATGRLTKDNSGNYIIDTDVFPWIRDNIYGGNDFGGSIEGSANLVEKVREGAKPLVYGYNGTTSPVLNASSYVEYYHGRVDTIYGGNYGFYDYYDPLYNKYTYTAIYDEENDEIHYSTNAGVANLGTSRDVTKYTKPHLENAFVNISPAATPKTGDVIAFVFGAGMGTMGYEVAGDADKDLMQQRSYVLVDIPDGVLNFKDTYVFGSGAYSGLGMFSDANPELTVNYNNETGEPTFDADNYSAIVDLINGRIKEAYGASYNEGWTRRSVVNVPATSTVKLDNIYGGGHGATLTEPCDVYESIVNYSSNDASVELVFGGNNNTRRSMYSFVNINSQVWNNKASDYLATVYGAGNGKATWTGYTQINLNPGANVSEVYGGGFGGRVLDKVSFEKWVELGKWQSSPSEAEEDVVIHSALPSGYSDQGLNSKLVRTNIIGADIDGEEITTKCNTNIYINGNGTDGIAKVGLAVDNRPSGGNVKIWGGYCYGGGYGIGHQDKTTKKWIIDDPEGGIVSGSTYVGLHGGSALKDIYAAGTLGGVMDYYGSGTDNIVANAYIEGGYARNVYGGGWEGDVGKTGFKITYNSQELSSYLGVNDVTTLTVKQIENILADKEVPGKTNVVIGIREDLATEAGKTLDYYYGVPAIERRAFAGGEGGSVIGTANITMNNGYIGYIYDPTIENSHNAQTEDEDEQKMDKRYVAKIDDETHTDGIGLNRLKDDGNIYGGGYDDKSIVDESHVIMYGGFVRTGVYGGGEIATIGRGKTKRSSEDENAIITLDQIYKTGTTNVTIYGGNVLGDVYGGGRGFSASKEYGHGDVRFYTDGYVFGKTRVYIHGGTIGTLKGVDEKNGSKGNVFGGGNQGFVYSGYGSRGADGYYYDNATLTEDCMVLISPYAKVLNGTVGPLKNTDAGSGTKSFTKNQYIPTAYLNDLHRTEFKTTYAGKIDEEGVQIRNAVFAGGNVSSGEEMFANTVTVYGNASATLYDVYNHDLITIGTDNVGGLYGDGNLTKVNGYRELNITNYGTDYWSFTKKEISLDDYYTKLTDRERAYFQLKFRVKDDLAQNANGLYYFTYTNKQGNQATYTEGVSGESFTVDQLKAKNIFPDDYFTSEGKPNPAHWVEVGVCTVYAGRLLNTIQRADFVGIFGSRMVMQGAQDRVSAKADYTKYTINRVGEISLNQKASTTTGETVAADQNHGNYFGIYSIVNYLGNLTSDVDFTTTRVTDSESEYTADGNTSFYVWKDTWKNDPRRNDGTAPNEVALASGVYLELTNEPAEGSNSTEKDWGYATGVIKLDLINVMPHIGGGYVYAKNEHRVPTGYTANNVKLMSDYNKGSNNNTSNQKAKSYVGYSYSDTKVPIQTSGNFVQTSRIVIDDCYPDNGLYDGENAAPAHYWFLKGTVYVYDIKVSAYTGAPSAYTKSIKIPLTITAGSDGKIKLLDVKPSKYAYWTKTNGHNDPTTEGKVLINNQYYLLNDTISYWDWCQLSNADKEKFVDETYVAMYDFYIGSEKYVKGETWLPSDYTTLCSSHPTVSKDIEGIDIVSVTDVVRPSNNLSHANGYALTLSMTNPAAWDTYYTPQNAADVRAVMDHEESGKEMAPTYKAIIPQGHNGVFGKKYYEKGQIITWNTVSKQIDLSLDYSDDIAQFAPAYILLDEYENWNVNNVIPMYNENNPALKNDKSFVTNDVAPESIYSGINAAPAYYCIDAWELKKEGLEHSAFHYGTCMSKEQVIAVISQYYPDYTQQQLDAAFNAHFTPAYYCIKAGYYGGKKFENGYNYNAEEAWAALNKDEREGGYFTFNYDAFDVLINPLYGEITQDEDHNDVLVPAPWSYDNTTENDVTHQLFAKEQSIDYEAIYEGDKYLYCNKAQDGSLSNFTWGNTLLAPGDEGYPAGCNFVIYNDPSDPDNTLHNRLSRSQYESLPNACKKYAPIDVKAAGDDCYVVISPFNDASGKPYAIGNTLTKDDYDGLFDNQYVGIIENLSPGVTYYYDCTSGSNLTYITSNVYNSINDTQNFQKGFAVVGHSPEESTTLYVSGESDLMDLSRGKVFTVEYVYNYQESDLSGSHIRSISERHIVNVHVEFKSGKPLIGDLATPPTILPGNLLGINKPEVTEGAYHTLDGGWELFMNSADANKGVNGVEFDKDATRFYWYQDEYWVAYYARNYMGKSYSAPVKISVANYHHLDDVMADKDHHMYVDNPNVKRNSKIYLDDRTCTSDNTKSELDLLKDFYELSLSTEVASEGALAGHALLDNNVAQANHLEFILSSDLAPRAYTQWNPIGNDQASCFEGNIHGDGHTITGLSNSLFGYLCGNVYNLGVTGSFTTSGIANNGGLAENCWINTSGTIAASTKAIMGTDTIRNSYYPDNLGYISTTGATPRPIEAFRNGEVAYGLNGFYLTKRYNDHNNAVSSGAAYRYYDADHSNNKRSAIKTAYYENADNATYQYTLEYKNKKYINDLTMGYVEYRFIDGDFRYSQGNIPSTQNERYYVNADNEADQYNGGFYPVWPDDYIYFGQKLTYGYELDPEVSTYQSKPSAINKEDRYYESTDPENDPSMTATFWIVNGNSSNRVFRAPAYYGNSTMGVAHFNQYAVLPAQTATANTPLAQSLQGLDAYPGMTAIDFTAFGTDSWNKGWTGGKFMTPVMDMWLTEPLTGFRTDGQTRNLLVYARDNSENATDVTNLGILNGYLFEPVYDIYANKLDNEGQPTVVANDYQSIHKVAQDTINMVHGHLVVKKTDGKYYAAGDQFLVDLNDFNAPKGYDMDGNLIWYQRTPDVFVKNAGTGWETISLPFTARVVSTSQKGVITHFYSGSNIGHEYWLRTPSSVETGQTTKVIFQTMAKTAPKADISYRNSFLWDYYYSHENRKDKNEDLYQEYYNYHDKDASAYTDYPLGAAATPYLIGFPSERYYEFDMSGEFEPKNVYGNGPEKLDRQTITFISDQTPGAKVEIGVSDVDYENTSGTPLNGYTFKPTYQTIQVDGPTNYLLNAVDEADPNDENVIATYAGTVFRNEPLPDGFNENTDQRPTLTTVPFRAYFTTQSGSHSDTRRAGTRGDVLYIDYSGDVMPLEDLVADRGLLIYGQDMNICVESTLEYPTEVTIHTVSGKQLKQFTIQPGTKVQVPVYNRGVYIVNHKKIAVTR